MKYFLVRFESDTWCGYEEEFLVKAPSTYTAESLEIHRDITMAADEWLYENIEVEDIEDENGDLDESAMDAERGGVTITTTEVDPDTYESIDPDFILEDFVY